MKTRKSIVYGLLAVALSTVVHATCASDVDMGNHRIANVSDPVNSKDVVNKRYLEVYMYETMKNKYIRDNTNEVVLDVSTNLMWQDDATAATVKKPWLTPLNYYKCTNNYTDCENTDGDTAATYCENFSLGGYTDWRLPSKEELFGIVKSTVSDPSISNIFQHTASYYYWSSTTNANYSGTAWFVHFYYGYQFYENKNPNDYVRCVRAGQ